MSIVHLPNVSFPLAHFVSAVVQDERAVLVRYGPPDAVEMKIVPLPLADVQMLLNTAPRLVHG